MVHDGSLLDVEGLQARRGTSRMAPVPSRGCLTARRARAPSGSPSRDRARQTGPAAVEPRDFVIPPLRNEAAAEARDARTHAGVVDLDGGGGGVPGDDDGAPTHAAPADAGANSDGRAVIVRACLSIVVLPKISFLKGSSAFTPESTTKLDDAERTLHAYPHIRVDIEGHTDMTESAHVGLERAVAVKRELVRRGVDAARLRTRNAGASKPIDTNATPEGRAYNRRTDLVIRP